jgi:hypothetical protein
LKTSWVNNVKSDILVDYIYLLSYTLCDLNYYMVAEMEFIPVYV